MAARKTKEELQELIDYLKKSGNKYICLACGSTSNDHICYCDCDD